jgi:hypothetical protein
MLGLYVVTSGCRSGLVRCLVRAAAFFFAAALYEAFQSYFRGTIMTLNLAEEDTKAGLRSELVTISDIVTVMEMTKDQLEEYAMSRFGTVLNKNEKIKLMRLKVVNSIKEKLKHPTDVKPDGNRELQESVVVSRNPEFLFNPKNRKVFEYTELLAKRGELVECYLVDKKGNKL